MKRDVFERLQILPYTPGDTMDRLGSLSAVLGIQVQAPESPGSETETTLRITVTHSDEETGSFENVLDPRLFLEETRKKYDPEEQEKLQEVFYKATAEAGDLVNVDIDLVGCKRYVKIKVAYTGDFQGTCVAVLGDNLKDPMR